VRQLRHPRLDDVELTDVMHALSDPARVAIVRALLRADGALTCGEITGDKPKSSMSHHFKALRNAGIVETRVDGKEHQNRLRTPELERRFPGLTKAIFKLVLAEDAARPPPAPRSRRR
jgi:DNA-binding transcriptional ArsR family regulator